MTAMPINGGVFVSYRREESMDAAVEIYRALVNSIDAQQVFTDVESIMLGSDFSSAISSAIARSHVVLVLIGPRWLTLTQPDGERRLDRVDDFVRQEVEQALKSDATIIPVLLDKANMPGEQELPQTIRSIVNRQALSLISTPSGLEGIDRLLASVQSVLDDRSLYDVDEYSKLKTKSTLSDKQILILRSIGRYILQTPHRYSQKYMAEILVQNPELASLFVLLFETRFDPDLHRHTSPATRAQTETETSNHISELLEKVASFDEDNVLRLFLQLLRAISRTNFFQRNERGSPKAYLAWKLQGNAEDPSQEIWVCSRWVEGIYYRFGPIARGGVRWSDRPEGLRVEARALARRQVVQNAGLTPTGSMSGFYPRQILEVPDNDCARLKEGQWAYRTFVSALLDLTDNLVDGQIEPPLRTIRRDGDDPYLAIAPDLGTTSFSDIANELSHKYDFWLGDSLASGSSAGYDHKALGIAARGAWESVKRHFRELGIDTQTEEFTVVGVGDMSGDVFGNGMLLSEHIMLVAAFDHRHIFLDPNPDAAASFAERTRLYNSPRSSWADYDETLISEGGGVYLRTAKSVTITAQMRQILGIHGEATQITPAELAKAIITAPADLLWSGGIGTYVKSAQERHADIDDRANDNIRVDARNLRVRVVGEGGNLAISQLGRVEAAWNGVHINTDAIDNSAAAAMSDYEVNIKIALTPLVRSGDMTMAQRDSLLAEMTDEVADKVLRHSYDLNELLGYTRDFAGTKLTDHHHLIRYLIEHAGLNPPLEFIPNNAELNRRVAASQGLTTPEFSILMAYSKIQLNESLLNSNILDDPAFQALLLNYFPAPLHNRFSQALYNHPLRRQIITKQLVNDIIHYGGATFMLRAIEETGALAAQIARAFVICRHVFDLAGYIDEVGALDNQVSTDIQSHLHYESRRLLDRAVRWFVNNRHISAEVSQEIIRFTDPAASLMSQIPDLLYGEERIRHSEFMENLAERGVPPDLARRCAGLIDSFSLLDVVEVAADTDYDYRETASVYFAVSESFGFAQFLTQISSIPVSNRWETLAVGAARDDVYAAMRALTRAVLSSTDSELAAMERVTSWTKQKIEVMARLSPVMTSVLEMDNPGLAPVSVALRALNVLARQ